MRPEMNYAFRFFKLKSNPTVSLMEVTTEPPMDLLVSKHIRPSHLAWRGSNEVVSLSFNRCPSSSLRDRFQVNGSGFASRLGTLRFHDDCLHVSIRGTTSFLFSKLYKLLVLRLALS